MLAFHAGHVLSLLDFPANKSHNRLAVFRSED